MYVRMKSWVIIDQVMPNSIRKFREIKAFTTTYIHSSVEITHPKLHHISQIHTS